MSRSRRGITLPAVALLLSTCAAAAAPAAPAPAAPGEHPRLIFRRGDVARIRAAAGPEMIAGVLERLRQTMRVRTQRRENINEIGYVAAGFGVLHVFEGDAGMAAQAADVLEGKVISFPFREMLTPLESSNRLLGAALAYDLCHDAWDGPFRAKVRAFLVERARAVLDGPGSKGPPWDATRAAACGAAGTAALAVLGDPGAPAGAGELLARSRKAVEAYLASGVSALGHGVQGEGQKHVAFAGGVLPFLHAYRVTKGEGLAGAARARELLTALAAVTVPGVGTPLFGAPGGAKDRSGVFAMGFGSVAERDRPAVLWLFRNVVGERNFDVTRPSHAAYVLAGYPYGVEAADPAEALRPRLADREGGVYVFRNRWRDSDDFVSIVNLAPPPAGAGKPLHTVGALRIWGLGGRWAARKGPHNDAGWVPRQGRVENGAFFFGDDVKARVVRPAQATHFEGATDGSGCVTLKYAGKVRRAGKDAGAFEALRSFACDYSGESGAAGLFVTADRLAGARGVPRAWTLHPGCFDEMRARMNEIETADHGDLDDNERKKRIRALQDEIKREYVKLDGNTFTLVGPAGASIRGTVVAPKGAVVRESINYPWWSFVYVEGAEEYLVVMTVQRGGAPAVSVEGEGLGAIVTVGGRTVRFDGAKIVVE